MFEPIIKKYFIVYHSFPYLPNHTIGYFSMVPSIFVIWEHYYRQYYKGIVDVKVDASDAL